MGEDLEKLKQRLSLLDYLQQQHWVFRPAGHGPEFVGLCPLHLETRPSFYVNARKNLFYCHGCGQGGDLLRFVQLSRQLSFRQSLAYLEQYSALPTDPATVLEQAAAFYQQQLDRYPEALGYLKQRGLCDPTAIQELRIGYAPGGCLRRQLTVQGYSGVLLQRLGLLNTRGCDAFYQCITFPCHRSGHVVNLYGRSITAAVAHRFLPGSKGGLYAWEGVQQCREVILVEGLFDYAVLWQAGFRQNVMCNILAIMCSCRLCGVDTSKPRKSQASLMQLHIFEAYRDSSQSRMVPFLLLAVRDGRATGLTRAMARRFMSRSTFAYRFVVFRLAWPR